MNYLALFLSSFLSATLFPGGSEVYLAFLVSAKQHPIFALLVVASLGNTLGAFLNFGMGYFARTKLKQSTQAEAVKRGLGRYGEVLLIFSWVPIVGDLIVLAAGYLKLSFAKAAPWILLGKIARYSFVVLITQYFT